MLQIGWSLNDFRDGAVIFSPEMESLLEEVLKGKCTFYVVYSRAAKAAHTDEASISFLHRLCSLLDTIRAVFALDGLHLHVSQGQGRGGKTTRQSG